MTLRALALCAVIAAVPQAEKQERPMVKSVPGQGARLITAKPDGAILDVALPRRQGGGREILLLVRPETKQVKAAGKPAPDCTQETAPDSAPRQLIRLDPASEGTLTTVRADLPADSRSLAAVDLDGDGADELLIGRPGSVMALMGEGLSAVASHPDLSLDGSLVTMAPLPQGPARLVVPSLRGLALFAPGADGGAWASVARAPLPVEASLTGGEIKVRGLPLERVGGTQFAAGPRQVGSQRLQSLVLHPSAAGGEAEPLVTESWSLLPEPEEIVESTYMILDGKLALLAITRPGEKLSLLGEKLLRLFVLEADRSRTGRLPLLACRSRMNLWQLAHPQLIDVNRDGATDLVLGYWKGLKDSRVVLDAYMRGADGAFAKSARSTEFDIEDGDRGLLEYGRDVTGDGLADLIVRGGQTIMVHAGLPSRDGKALVAHTAAISVTAAGMDFSDDNDFDFSFGPLGGGEGDGARMRFRRRTSGDPRYADLDGDGRDEMIVVRPSEDEGAVHVICFTTGTP